MLVYIRKHQKTVMLFVAVIVIIAFTFFYDAGRGPDREKNSKLFSIDGKDYTLKDYEKILSNIATQLVPNCGIMDVFVDAWNTQRPVRQILLDKNLEKYSSDVDGQLYVGGLNIERDKV